MEVGAWALIHAVTGGDIGEFAIRAVVNTSAIGQQAIGNRGNWTCYHAAAGGVIRVCALRAVFHAVEGPVVGEEA